MSPDPISPFPLVRRGERIFPVRPLQQLLCARDHDVTVDGIFGPQTDSTVRGFQHALSLDVPSVVVDGIVGPVTWQALVSGMLSG